VRQPKAFLFDEPLSNLDAKMRVQMRMEISKLHHRLQSTMIYVTHDQVEAMTMGDRIVVMKDGLIQQVDTPLNIYEHPANKFVAGFIGSPPMNFFDGVLVQESDGMYFKGSDMKVKVEEGQVSKLKAYGKDQVVMGIRPEHIQDAAFAVSPDPQALIQANVEVVEPMGAEVYLYLSIGSDNFIARVDSHEQAQVNQTVSLALDMSHASFFATDEEGVRIV
jgi:multiple sugar transport system ATP-binding protein